MRHQLLSEGDPDPVERIRMDGAAPLALVCEHAGNAIPAMLRGLGLGPGEVDRHIGWDIGAGAVARGLSALLDAPLIMQRYSRLVIDCNRPQGAPTSILAQSDGITVPANKSLSAEDRRRREDGIFRPYAEAAQKLTRRPGLKAVFSIHSFTPVMDGIARPWDIGFLYRTAESGGAELTDLCQELWPHLCVGRNEPYRIEPDTDWLVPACLESAGLRHCLVEIRNDHIRSPEGQRLWAERLARLISAFMERAA